MGKEAEGAERRPQKRQGGGGEREAEKQVFHGWLERNKAALCLGGTALLKAGSVIKGKPGKKSEAVCAIQTSITQSWNKI